MSAFKLSNEELEIRLKEFVSKEKFLLHIILDHIKEVDRRKIYLERAYSSLYEYLVKELGYSGSAAMRRQEAARLLIEIPDLGKKIQSGQINLSQIGELSKAIKEKEKSNFKKYNNLESPHLTSKEKSVLISDIEGKSALETQKILSKALDLPITKNDSVRAQKDESMRIEMTLSKSQYDLLLKCKGKVAHGLQKQYGDTSWGSVLSYLAEKYLDQKQSSKSKNKEKISSEKDPHLMDVSLSSVGLVSSNLDANTKGSSLNANLESSNLDKTIYGSLNSKDLDAASDNTKTRPPAASSGEIKPKVASVTRKIRQQITERDLKCQYRDPKTNRLCGATFALEVDHKVPKWSQNYNKTDDVHELTNLQILCAGHNRYKYRKECRIH